MDFLCGWESASPESQEALSCLAEDLSLRQESIKLYADIYSRKWSRDSFGKFKRSDPDSDHQMDFISNSLYPPTFLLFYFHPPPALGHQEGIVRESEILWRVALSNPTPQFLTLAQHSEKHLKTEHLEDQGGREKNKISFRLLFLLTISHTVFPFQYFLFHFHIILCSLQKNITPSTPRPRPCKGNAKEERFLRLNTNELLPNFWELIATPTRILIPIFPIFSISKIPLRDKHKGKYPESTEVVAVVVIFDISRNTLSSYCSNSREQ